MRLLLDAMLGGLRSYLRMCGHDTAYTLEIGIEADEAILAVAAREDRRLITRDRQLGARAENAMLLTSRETRAQLAELAAAGVDLTLPATPDRCSDCNGGLERVEPEARTPPNAPDPDESPVWRCRDCGQLFWKGSHWDRVADTLAELA